MAKDLIQEMDCTPHWLRGDTLPMMAFCHYMSSNTCHSCWKHNNPWPGSWKQSAGSSTGRAHLAAGDVACVQRMHLGLHLLRQLEVIEGAGSRTLEVFVSAHLAAGDVAGVQRLHLGLHFLRQLEALLLGVGALPLPVPRLPAQEARLLLELLRCTGFRVYNTSFGACQMVEAANAQVWLRLQLLRG